MRENGRFARTFVNRVWRKLMGRGIVEPADDMDAKPFNEDLIDWISWDFAEHKYDVNYLISQIMTSRAYELPATDSKQEFQGPQFRRMQAEQFADAISSITGERNRDVLARDLRNIVGRHHGRVAERLFHHRGQLLKQLIHVRLNHKLMMLGAETLGHRTSIFRLVEVFLAETDGKRLDRTTGSTCHESHHRR